MRSVLVGATYSTGREVTEFFLKYGGFSSLVCLILATALFSFACIIALELARRFQVLDYKSFSRVYLGRLWFLYEFGFIFGVLLTLSTIAAAAAEIGSDLFGLSPLACSVMLMAAIALLVYGGSGVLERIMSIWSMFFYASYFLLLGLSLWVFHEQVLSALTPAPISGEAIITATIYAGFNCSILPVIIFVARHLQSTRDATVAGALAGPLVFVPGLALLLMLVPFLPGIITAPVPVMTVLGSLKVQWLAVVIKLAILGELALNGAGLLHGINERIANSIEERKSRMPWIVRPAIAVSALIFCVYVAERVGLIALVAVGFRSGALAFLIIMVLPLITRGLWIVTGRRTRKPGENPSAG